jgi:peroxiredoxin
MADRPSDLAGFAPNQRGKTNERGKKDKKLMKILASAAFAVHWIMFLGFTAVAQPAAAQERKGPNLEEMFLSADTDAFDPGLPMGAEFPAIRALYQGEEISGIDAFMGEKGLAFFAVRSVDWCPYCRHEMAELQAHVADFERAGIGVVAITYDSPELQQVFIDAGSITYPFVADIDTVTMRALGILNTQYSPGEPAYGIPYPGIFVLDPARRIVGKIFIESYRQRVDGQGVLNYALEVLK